MGNSITLIEKTGYETTKAFVKKATAEVASQEILLEELKNLKASIGIAIEKIQTRYELKDNFQKLVQLYEELALHLHGSEQSDDTNSDINHRMGDELDGDEDEGEE